MKEQMVMAGLRNWTAGDMPRWHGGGFLPDCPKEIPLNEAVEIIATKFRVSMQDAKLNLLKHGYASMGRLDLCLRGFGFDGNFDEVRRDA